MAKALLIAALVTSLAAPAGAGEPVVEKNVVYGMYSGLALLMDVHRPEKPNGRGIVFVAGSAWHAPVGYDAVALKDVRAQVSAWVPPFVRAGYTVFAINHRAAPRFHYPAAVEDVQRAVRFVRHEARRFGIDPLHLGGLGGSSGGHLVGLVAMLAASGIAGDADPVNREPATLQCAVLRAAPTDLKRMLSGDAAPELVSWMELPPPPSLGAENDRTWVAASTVTHVSSASPPVMLVHGDADKTVPIDQAVALESALRAAKVPVKLLRLPGGVHGPTFEDKPARPHPPWPDYMGEAIRWMDQHLGRSGS
jgi:acetyl esterase/lipase